MEEEFKDERGLPKAVIVIIAVVVLAVVLYVSLGQREKFVPIGPGTKAIEFSLPDLEGDMTSFEDYKGKVIFLNFWATWCGPCEEEMPSMQKLNDTFKNRKFIMVAVSVDKDEVEVIKEFRDKHNLRFLILHDKKGNIKESYKTTGVPETFIIDQNGIIAEKVWGAKDWGFVENISTIIDLLDNGPRVPEAYRNSAAKPLKK